MNERSCARCGGRIDVSAPGISQGGGPRDAEHSLPRQRRWCLFRRRSARLDKPPYITDDTDALAAEFGAAAGQRRSQGAAKVRRLRSSLMPQKLHFLKEECSASPKNRAPPRTQCHRTAAVQYGGQGSPTQANQLGHRGGHGQLRDPESSRRCDHCTQFGAPWDDYIRLEPSQRRQGIGYADGSMWRSGYICPPTNSRAKGPALLQSSRSTIALLVRRSS